MKLILNPNLCSFVNQFRLKNVFQNFISDSQILLTWLPSSSRMRVCCLRVAADHQFSKCTYFLIFKLYLPPDFKNVPTSWYSDFQIVPTSWFSNCTYFLIFKLYLHPDFQNLLTSYVVTSRFAYCTYFLIFGFINL